VIVVWAAVIAISFAFAVIPSPPITFKVLVAAIVPPPVSPVPAVTLTPLWSICSFATKFAKLSWSIVACVAVNTVPYKFVAFTLLVALTFKNEPLALELTLPITSNGTFGFDSPIPTLASVTKLPNEPVDACEPLSCKPAILKVSILLTSK